MLTISAMDEKKTEYVCGFLLTPPMGATVALISKNRPKWQAGKVNGIGGKIEPNESPHEAMVREFREETGASVLDWEHVITYHDQWHTATIYFFRAFANRHLIEIVGSMTDEQVSVYQVSKLPGNVIDNLRWLIPLCLDNNVKFPLVIEEKER